MKVKEVTEAQFIALHLMGRYQPPFPELMVWRVEADQEEIDDNWRWVLLRASVYKQFEEAHELPDPFKFNEEWECKECPYRVVCETTTGQKAPE